MNSTSSKRPPLSAELSGNEIARWYWLKDELFSFAKSLGLKGSGSKELLTSRIAAALDGDHFNEPIPTPVRPAKQLTEPLYGATVIPTGQRSSQLLRAWFTEHIGASFHFDAHMRTFIATSDGARTLNQAIEHWHATRNQGPSDIDSQFEYNRFTRAWHLAHPAGNKEHLLADWNTYRSQPIDERGRI